MNKAIPKKFTSLLPPTIVSLPSGKYFVIAGAPKAEGWYPIDDSFNYEKVIRGWTRLSTADKEVIKPTSDWVWKVSNSKNNGFYTVTFDKSGWNCNCTGFGFRRKCRHIEEAKTKMN